MFFFALHLLQTPENSSAHFMIILSRSCLCLFRFLSVFCCCCFWLLLFFVCVSCFYLGGGGVIFCIVFCFVVVGGGLSHLQTPKNSPVLSGVLNLYID